MALIRLLSLLTVLAILSAACGYLHFDPAKGTEFALPREVLPINNPWDQADLRLIDPPDAPHPAQDVIATYTRTVNLGKYAPLGKFPSMESDQEVHVRLDFLDLTLQNQSDVYLAFDHQPGGSSEWPWGGEMQIAWDTLVLLPASGQIQAWDKHYRNVNKLSIRLMRNPILDYLEVQLDVRGLPGSDAGYGIQVITTPNGKSEIADQVAPFRSNGYSPKPAQILFAFWNAFPAYTPAKALRRWDGAHTGPLGGRHGLYNLLRAAHNHKIPLTLLDLKSPISISALDYVDGIPLVQKMDSEGLLLLPEAIPFLPGLAAHATPATSSAALLAYLAKLSRQTGMDFGLGASQFAYSPLTSGLPNRYPIIFTRLFLEKGAGGAPLGIVKPLRWRDRVVIPIPEVLLAEQASLDGLSLETRKALVWAALSANSKIQNGGQPMLVLGGDLPSSEWGAPQVARAGFSYLTAHPWIHFVGAHELLSAHPERRLSALKGVSTSDLSGLPDFEESNIATIIERITHAQRTPLTLALLQALTSLYGPTSPEPVELSDLRAVYADQLDVLVAAAQWSANPAPISTCDTDFEQDGQPECLLATEQTLAVYDAVAGSLTYLFVRLPSGIHEIIGPSSQFAFGLSESSSWVLNMGLRADPAVIPGAFADEGDHVYQAILDYPQLTFVGQGITKSFRPITGGIRVEYSGSEPKSAIIPLALNPWARFTPAWGEQYSWNATPEGGVWKMSSGPGIHIRSNAQLNISHFGESRSMMESTENPNREYPPGHFLPFPLAIINLQAPGDLFVELSISGP